MREGDGSFNLTEVDVVVLDDEDICRAAASSALMGAGFISHRVHEAESGEEALETVVELQKDASVVGVPVIVFLDLHMSSSTGMDCARELCALFSSRTLRREPFLVCASARRVQNHASENSFFHFFVSKTFEASRINSVVEACRAWFTKGGGEPGALPIQQSMTVGSLASLPSMGALPELSNSGYPGDFSASSPMSQLRPVAKPGPVGGPGSGGGGRIAMGVAPVAPGGVPVQHPGGQRIAAVHPVTVASPGNSMPRRTAATIDLPPMMAASDRMTPPVPARKLGGNTVDSLDSMLPPRPPFEDVEMIGLVGRGSFGRVYEARWGIAPVALKVVEHHNSDQRSVVTFEGALSASLAHPNLVQTFKYSVRAMNLGQQTRGRSDVSGHEVWIVQEWCGLGTLAQRSTSEMMGGSIEEVVEVGCEISGAASYLHSRGIIHGDLTANNVLLTERPTSAKGYTTKVSDFGLARVLDSGVSGIQTATMGTVTYMPPELFQLDGGALTKKVDVYAFGVILWQLCSGVTPFAGLQPTQIVVMVAQGATLELPFSAPAPLREVFTMCTGRTPDSRPAFDRVFLQLYKLYEACQAGMFEKW